MKDERLQSRAFSHCAKSRGITRKQLADAVGVSRRSLIAYEMDERRPSAPTVERLAGALNFPSRSFQDLI